MEYYLKILLPKCCILLVPGFVSVMVVCLQIRNDADKKDTKDARVVSEAAEALVQLNLALIVYSDLRTCDAMDVLKDHFNTTRQDSVFRNIYSRHDAKLQEIVSASGTTEDNPKLVTLYQLLSKKYSVNDARGTEVIVKILTIRLLMKTVPVMK